MTEASILKLEPIEIDNNQVVLQSASSMSHSNPTKRSRKSAHPSKTIQITSPSSSMANATLHQENSPPIFTIPTTSLPTTTTKDNHLCRQWSIAHVDEQENHDRGDDDDEEERLSNHSSIPSKRPRLTHDKRLEANARERERVHNLTAAFEALRRVIPMYGDQPKLSRLSILRIACAYVLVLGTLNEIDFSEGQNAYTFNECFHMLSSTILSELKRKKTINHHRHD